MEPLQWMGAVKIRVPTADKSITIIHQSTQLQTTNVLRNEKLCVYKKQIDCFENRKKAFLL